MLDLQTLLEPRSIAVVGAGANPDSMGSRQLRVLVEFGYAGELYAVNPRGVPSHGQTGYEDLRDLPTVPDLCILAVPAVHIESVLATAGELGVPYAYVYSSLPADEPGIETSLQRIVDGTTIRLLGPNCVGMHSPRGRVTFSRNVRHQPGGIAVVSQSGGLSLDFLGQFQARQVGLRTLLSVGNCLDVGVTELVEALTADDETTAIGLYLEDASDGRALLTAIGRVTPHKPVVVLKGGRTPSGAASAATHTGALGVADDKWTAGLTAAGAVVASSVDEFISRLAGLGGALPLPAGDNFAVAGNGGGMTVLTVDAMDSRGLRLGPLSAQTQEKLAATAVPAGASLGNPTDIPAVAWRAGDPDALGSAVLLLPQDPGIDGLIIHFNLTAFANYNAEDLLAALERLFAVLSGASKPILIALRVSLDGDVPALYERLARTVGAAGLPIFSSAVEAADVAAVMRQRARWLAAWAEREAAPPTYPPDVRSGAAPPLLTAPDATAATSAERLHRDLVQGGIPCVRTSFTTAVDEVLRELEALDGRPAVLKLDSTRVIHKSDAGGVILGITTPEDATRAYARLQEVADSHGALPDDRRVIVQELLDGDFLEVFVGMEYDPALGEVIVVGLGGIYVEIMRDVAFALAPLDEARAEGLLHQLRAFPLLDGARGRPHRDVAALARLIARFSEYALALEGRVAAIDLNPVLVGVDGFGAHVVDWRASLAASPEVD